MSRAEFAISLRTDGTGTVRLNGEDVPGVISVRVDGARDRTPVVTIQLLSDVEVEGVGTLAASAPDTEMVTEDLLAVLDAIDPETLDRDALAGMGLGDEGTPAQRYLDIIRRYVRGD